MFFLQNHARAAAGPSVDRSRGFGLACDKRKGSSEPRTKDGILETLHYLRGVEIQGLGFRV